MAFSIKEAEYYYTTVKDRPGEAYKLLSLLAERGVNQLAFAAIPVGPDSTQLTIFPDDPPKFTLEARNAGMTIDGPHYAFLVQGNDELGALAEIHEKLYKANINIYASNGIGDARGCHGYIIYVKHDDFERAKIALGL
ncbi:MAG: hypothetical protein ACLFV2_08435 [Desulfurivibrionaceae bacterium]